MSLRSKWVRIYKEYRDVKRDSGKVQAFVFLKMKVEKKCERTIWDWIAQGRTILRRGKLQ